MSNNPIRIEIILVVAFSTVTSACLRDDEVVGESSSSLGSAAEPIVSSSNEPPNPVASLQLESSEHVVDFYEFGRGVLIIESAPAYTDPLLHLTGGERVDQLGQIWDALAPARPMPKSLSDLQARLEHPVTTPDKNTEPAAAQAKGDDDPTLTTIAATESLSGCDNGCCDYDWLSTFVQCDDDWDYSWFLFNKSWSSAWVNSIKYYTGMVCAAIGTSTFSVSITNGHGGSWSVAEAHWRSYSWLVGFDESDQNMTSSVNSSVHPHTHTYCGGVHF